MTSWTKGDPLPGEDASEHALDVDTLVMRAQGGSLAAFEALYERYNGQIHSYLSRMVGNDGVGCELTQEVFLKAWSALPELRTPASFVRWLYRIALNCARDYQERFRRMPMVPLDTCTQGEDLLSIEGPEASVEKAELLQLALSQVSPVYRTCLILYVIEELPRQQIAQRLNIKEVSVNKYVSRGKEELRQIYHQLLRGQTNRVRARGRRGG